MQELVYFQKANSMYEEYNKTLNFDLLDSAMEECNKAIAIKVDYAEAYYLRALINIELDEYEEKEKDLKTALKIFSDRLNHEKTKEINYMIGLCFEQLFQHSQAVKYLKNAIGVDDNYFEAYFELGIIANNIFYKEERENAISYLNRAIELRPEMAESYFWRGIRFEKLKDYANAIADYSKSIELDNSNWQFYNYRGELYLLLNQWDNAIDDYRVFRKLYPHKHELEIELYDERKYGTCLSLCFHAKNENVNINECFIEDIIMTPFSDIFRKVNDKFDIYGITSYSQNDVQEIHSLLKKRCAQLISIKTYNEFFDLMVYTRFICTIIRNIDDIGCNWLMINNKIILLNQKLLKVFAENIENEMLLNIEGI